MITTVSLAEAQQPRGELRSDSERKRGAREGRGRAEELKKRRERDKGGVKGREEGGRSDRNEEESDRTKAATEEIGKKINKEPNRTKETWRNGDDRSERIHPKKGERTLMNRKGPRIR